MWVITSPKARGLGLAPGPADGAFDEQRIALGEANQLLKYRFLFFCS